MQLDQILGHTRSPVAIVEKAWFAGTNVTWEQSQSTMLEILGVPWAVDSSQLRSLQSTCSPHIHVMNFWLSSRSLYQVMGQSVRHVSPESSTQGNIACRWMFCMQRATIATTETHLHHP